MNRWPHYVVATQESSNYLALPSNVGWFEGRRDHIALKKHLDDEDESNLQIGFQVQLLVVLT